MWFAKADVSHHVERQGGGCEGRRWMLLRGEVRSGIPAELAWRVESGEGKRLRRFAESGTSGRAGAGGCSPDGARRVPAEEPRLPDRVYGTGEIRSFLLRDAGPGTLHCDRGPTADRASWASLGGSVVVGGGGYAEVRHMTIPYLPYLTTPPPHHHTSAARSPSLPQCHDSCICICICISLYLCTDPGDHLHLRQPPAVPVGGKDHGKHQLTHRLVLPGQGRRPGAGCRTRDFPPRPVGRAAASVPGIGGPRWSLGPGTPLSHRLGALERSRRGASRAWGVSLHHGLVSFTPLRRGTTGRLGQVSPRAWSRALSASLRVPDSLVPKVFPCLWRRNRRFQRHDASLLLSHLGPGLVTRTPSPKHPLHPRLYAIRAMPSSLPSERLYAQSFLVFCSSNPPGNFYSCRVPMIFSRLQPTRPPHLAVPLWTSAATRYTVPRPRYRITSANSALESQLLSRTSTRVPDKPAQPSTARLHLLPVRLGGETVGSLAPLHPFVPLQHPVPSSAPLVISIQLREIVTSIAQPPKLLSRSLALPLSLPLPVTARARPHVDEADELNAVQSRRAPESRAQKTRTIRNETSFDPAMAPTHVACSDPAVVSRRCATRRDTPHQPFPTPAQPPHPTRQGTKPDS
ncbi:unnamed protein product [Diplocarpon coronariae]